jgi:hypothetical protein
VLSLPHRQAYRYTRISLSDANGRDTAARRTPLPRKFRVAFTNRRAARDALQRISAWPAEKVLMAHGSPVETDAKALLRRAFAWLAA